MNEVPTVDECLSSAARLLRNAEAETDHQKVEDQAQMAEVWVNIGHLLAARSEIDNL